MTRLSRGTTGVFHRRTEVVYQNTRVITKRVSLYVGGWRGTGGASRHTEVNVGRVTGIVGSV